MLSQRKKQLKTFQKQKQQKIKRKAVNQCI